MAVWFSIWLGCIRL